MKPHGATTGKLTRSVRENSQERMKKARRNNRRKLIGTSWRKVTGKIGDSSRPIGESSLEKSAQEAVETSRGHYGKAHEISSRKLTGTDEESSQEQSEKAHRNQLEKGHRKNWRQLTTNWRKLSRKKARRKQLKPHGATTGKLTLN